MLEEQHLSIVGQGLSREFLFIEPSRLKQRSRLLLWTGTLFTLIFFSPVPLLLALLMIWFIPVLFLRFVTDRRKTKLQKQLLHALPTIASTLRAGHTFERAVEATANNEPPPISQEFELVLKEIQFGATLAEALNHLVERCPLRDLEVMVRAVQISLRAGSNLAEAFDRVEEIVRTRAALKDRVSALTAQGRLQAWVAILMPVALILALNTIAPGYLSPLFETGVGRLGLILSAIALAIGGFWVHRISRMEFFQ